MSSTSLRAERVAFAYSDLVQVLDDVTFHLPPGWTGLVGANGSGKTTLLRLLSGELRPTSGRLRFSPESPRVLLCAQRVDEADAEVHAFAEAMDADAFKLRGLLELEPEQLLRWDTLSAGERKRWQIGGALHAEPDVLLLDEPTNHLDAEARRLLTQALRRFGGVGVLVSHDRELLDGLTTQTLRVQRGEVSSWTGNYSDARDQWESARAALLAEHESAKAQKRKAKAALHQARTTLASVTASRRTSNRMKDRNDNDARSMGAKVVAGWAQDGAGQRVAVTRRLEEKASAKLERVEVEKELGGEVFAGFERAARPLLATLSADEVKPGEEVLLRDVRLTLRRESRVWLSGKNGSGKSTLVHALLAASGLPEDRVLVLPQELSIPEAEAALEAVRSLPPDERGRVLSFVATLGVDPGRLLSSEAPSPGEARKLLIARGLSLHAWLLVLDEPTNHLDLPSVEQLEKALAAYPGALLLVSHDAAFARSCTTERWHLQQGRVEVSSSR